LHHYSIAGRVLLFAVDVDGQVHQSVGVPPFIVVPRNELVEVGVEGNACFSINDGAAWIMEHILGNNLIISVSKNSLHFTSSSCLECGLDLVTCACLFGTNGQIDKGNIRCWNTDGHTCELSVEFWDNFSDGLGCSSTGRDEVVQGTSSSAPVLSALGRSINDELIGSSGVDGGHETFDDSELVVDNLGKGCKTVRCTGSVGEDFGVSVSGVVHTHDVHGSIGRRGRDDDTLGSSLEVSRTLEF
jgi:hypothetical protein